MPTFYDVLGVQSTDSAATIQQAFRRLSARVHPDLHGGSPDATRHFQALSEAFHTLRDPKARARYDATLRPPPLEPPRPEPALPAYGDDVHLTLALSFQEAILGGIREVVVPGRGRPVRLQLPANVCEQTELRFANIGHPGRLRNGAGVVHVHYQEDPRYERRGATLHYYVPLSPARLALGISVGIPMPDGATREFKVAAGQPARDVRLNGEGLPRHSGGRGAFIIHPVVQIPTPMSPRARALYTALLDAER